MVTDDAALMDLIRAIVTGDRTTAMATLDATPALVTAVLRGGATRSDPTDWFFPEIAHYVYRGDTALHAAAAAHRPQLVSELVERGASVHATNRRGATPLHYAADSRPGSPRWDPDAQHETIRVLVAAGADPNAVDKSGVAPLHRAIRTRGAAAVSALLDGGADVHLTNGSGSTPRQLAEWTTGKGGSGSDAAKAQQVQIIEILSAR